MWFVFALLSAVFAALTSILAKVGIDGVNSNLATAIRTMVVLAMAWGMVFVTNTQGGLTDISTGKKAGWSGPADMGGKPVMNITVYLGANAGNDPALRDAVRALGRWIGESGNALVYGGSKNGLMGALAESVLAAGGRATGVEPQIFVDQGFLYDELTELIVTRDFPERKAKMLELGDAFIAFPGGTGTLEEIAEVMSRVALGQLDAPCILYNLNGYYDGLRTQLAHMIELGLSSEARQRGIYFADDLEQIRQLLDPACAG